MELMDRVDFFGGMSFDKESAKEFGEIDPRMKYEDKAIEQIFVCKKLL